MNWSLLSRVNTCKLQGAEGSGLVLGDWETGSVLSPPWQFWECTWLSSQRCCSPRGYQKAGPPHSPYQSSCFCSKEDVCLPKAHGTFAKCSGPLSSIVTKPCSQGAFVAPGTQWKSKKKAYNFSIQERDAAFTLPIFYLNIWPKSPTVWLMALRRCTSIFIQSHAISLVLAVVHL